MHGGERSDESIVPQRRANKPVDQGAERAEGRDSAKGNSHEPPAPRTSSRLPGGHEALERIRLAAQRDRKRRFTALLHHIDVDRMRSAYAGMNRDAAPGIDGVRWEEYQANLEDHLEDLMGRVHRGAYRARASRRASIPKPDGGQRLLGIASLEDKIVQKAVSEVLGAIYEVDFLGFSYGFRPGRDAHMALDALAYGIKRRKVNWILDADIKGYFDAIPHDLLIGFIEERIADPRMLRLIRKWLRAGVLEGGELTRAKKGSPQGASISPLLANIYLHHVFDTWAHEWRRTHARGEVYIVRYADDIVVAFQHEDEAGQFLAALKERFGAHGLELHPDKTRLIEFGRYAKERRSDRGDDPPDTFDFLGFTHSCGTSGKGKFVLRRRTIKKRFRRTLQRMKMQLRIRMHDSTDEQGKWLRSVFAGYCRYFAVPTNMRCLSAFRRELARMWYQTLRRRGQKDRTTWRTIQSLLAQWLPKATCAHPWPEVRMERRLAGRST